MTETVRPGSLESADPISLNGLVEAFVDVALRHGRSIGAADILRRLPYDPSGMTLAGLPEVAASFGFEAHIASIALAAVPAITLPVIAFERGGKALVVTALSPADGTATVVVPSAGPTPRHVAVADLAAQDSGVIVFIKPATVRAEARADAAQPGAAGHWFWSTFTTFWREYSQVALAAFLINLVGLAAPLFVKNVYDRVIPNLAIPTLWALTAGVLIALVLDMVLRSVRSSVVDSTGRRVDLAVAGRLFDRMLAIRLEARPASAGVLASNLRDFDSVRDVMTSSTLIALTDLLFIGIFMAVMWVFVGPLTLVPLVAVVFVLVTAVLIQLPLSRAVNASQADSARRHGVLVEAAGSLETIKSIGAEGYLRRVWSEAVAATSRTASQARFWANLSANMMAFVNQAVSIVTVVWGVFLVIDGTITVGSLIAASILSGRILGPLANIVQTLARALQARTAYRTLDAMMSAPVEAPSAGDGRAPRSGDLVLRNVSLTYPGASVPALADVTLTIRKGERVGLIGRIGSGKTTIGRLIAGLYQPTTGQILIDGMDVRQFGADLRSLVGYGQQETELFTGTLRENVVMGLPHASQEAIARATRIGGVDAFASRHPLGLAMPIAERGRSLSGGQRQAIGLARMLIRSPKILFLDEPSAAMDTASERALVASLKSSLAPDVTLLISTHRDGLLDLVDRLLVFDGGRIVMDGPKGEVIARLRDAAKGAAAAGGAASGEKLK